MVLVWQYGSNMDEERINSPNRLKGKAKFVGLAIKKGYRLSFTHTNSEGVGTADILEADPNDYVIGCLYEMAEDMLKKLDKVEGVNSGSYERVEMTVARFNEKQLADFSDLVSATTHIVVNKEKKTKTNVEYANHILRGIIIHKMGKPYFDKIKETIIESNPSIQRDLLSYP